MTNRFHKFEIVASIKLVNKVSRDFKNEKIAIKDCQNAFVFCLRLIYAVKHILNINKLKCTLSPFIMSIVTRTLSLGFYHVSGLVRQKPYC